MNKRFKVGIVSLVAVLGLAACGDEQEETNQNESMEQSTNEENMDINHEEMDHSSSGEVPENLKTAENPTFEVGSNAIIENGHMEGMKGAKATIVGAYDTTAYVISYDPTSGGERVEDHKWVVQEEIKDANDKTLEPGSEVTIDASHMEGMKGATGEIVSSEKTTVYMIDYTPTNSSEVVKNHKWVTESELSAK